MGGGEDSQPAGDAEAAARDQSAASEEPAASAQPAPPASNASDGGSLDAHSSQDSSQDSSSSGSSSSGGDGGESEGALKIEAPAADTFSSAAQAVVGAADAVGTQVGSWSIPSGNLSNGTQGSLGQKVYAGIYLQPNDCLRQATRKAGQLLHSVALEITLVTSCVPACMNRPMGWPLKMAFRMAVPRVIERLLLGCRWRRRP